jgi:fructose-bisphosphate aldolase class II
MKEVDASSLEHTSWRCQYQLVFAEATRKYIEEGKDQQGKGFDPRKLLAPGAKAIEAKCKEKIELFGCAGKG